MGAFLLTLIGGAIAGAAASRFVVKREIGALRTALEQRGVPPPEAAAQPEQHRVSAPPSEIAVEISPEILMVISAAVAAFCGKKARIRRARVAGPVEHGSAWAQQGRVFVQASHNLAR